MPHNSFLSKLSIKVGTSAKMYKNLPKMTRLFLYICNQGRRIHNNLKSEPFQMPVYIDKDHNNTGNGYIHNTNKIL